MSAVETHQIRQVNARSHRRAGKEVMRAVADGKAVRVEANRARSVNARRAIVRPDRPSTRAERSLHAVPSAYSAPEAAECGVHEWRVERSREQRTQLHRAGTSRERLSSRREFSRAGAQAVPAEAQLLRAVAGVVAAIVAIVIAGLFVVAVFALGPEAGSSIIVQSGDTLTSIASAMGVDIDTDDVIADILALNVIDGQTIYAGQELILPRY